jgi:hypothetical protein
VLRELDVFAIEIELGVLMLAGAVERPSVPGLKRRKAPVAGAVALASSASRALPAASVNFTAPFASET